MKGFRRFAYGDSQAPHRLVSLRRPKGEPTQQRWIVAAFRDKSFDLRLEVFFKGERVDIDEAYDNVPYSELWSTLASPALCGAKSWLIGFRARYAMQAADFVGALERGEVALPKIKSGNNKGKHGCKLTMNRRVMEVDVVCGKNKIKILDWGNFGVLHDGYVANVEDMTGYLAAVVLRDYLEAMEAIGVRVSKTTSAQLGWNHFRTQCQPVELAVNLDTAARTLERRAYHGGRCEAFRVGDIPGTTFSLDVKSCYATICRDERLPVRLIEEYRHGLDVTAINGADDDHWIADVVLLTDEPDYPLAWNGSPIYPVGDFATSLPWPELRHALLRGRVTRVLRAARYAAAPVMREYAEWYLYWREVYRAAGNGLCLTPLKAMFNASLGYSAREKYEWVEWDTELGFPYWIGTTHSPEDHSSLVTAQKLDGERRWLRVAGEPRESMPFLHATICSYARVQLLDIFKGAGRENILYCDTDGVLVTRTGKRRLLEDSTMPGFLSRSLAERFPPGSARIQGQKSYRIGDCVIQAGVVKTRQSKLQQKTVLDVPTGRVGPDGIVEPWRFRCEDVGGVEPRWVNELE